MVRVERVAAVETFELRQRILRPHETVAQMALAGDDDPDAGHFVARSTEGVVVGTATVRRQAPPDRPELEDAWRLRGMATEEGWRNRGVGAAVLAAVLRHVAEHGGGLLWCNARIPAQRFYERAGFEAVGEPWHDPVIGPHVVMRRPVDGTPEPAG